VDQLVREACCCSPKKHKGPIDAPIMQRECCKIVKHQATTPPVATEADAHTMFAPVGAPAVTAPVMPPLRVARIAMSWRAQAPPLEPSLLSQHCALLV